MDIIADNRKAYFNYFVLEEFEAGVVLCGSEVKSLRQRRMNVSDAHVIEKNMELWLQNMHISEYKHAATNHAPKRSRKLLMKRKQIYKIAGKIKEQGLTVVPLSVYFNDKGLVKIKIAIVKGKKLYDKRENIKKRETDIIKRRALKGDF